MGSFLSPYFRTGWGDVWLCISGVRRVLEALRRAHVWIHLDVKKDDGTMEGWAFEAGTPNVLFRRGFTRDSLLPGTDVRVDGYQAKDGTNRANGRDMTFADGTKLFLGSSGTGAPYELAQPGVDTADPPR